jgi:hypothetical protein
MMARLVFVTLAVLALACVSVSASSAPVPEGFSLPNIFNPVLDRADGRDQAKTLVQLVAKEPKVAFGVGGPEAAVEDMWNGEKDPESSASVAQLKMLREVDSLTKLIEQGKKILKVLPRKQKRLSLLKSKLATILNAKAKREASEKLDEQQALLDAIKKREGKMSSRLAALKKSQNKLTKSVGKLQAVIAGPKKVSKASKPIKSVGAAKVSTQNKQSSSQASTKATANKRASFLEVEADNEMEAEMDSEADMEAEMDQELMFDAAEAYDQEIQQE